MKVLLNTKVGQIMLLTGWLFLLAAIGWGLFTGKIDYTFFGPVITAILGAFGYHFASTKGSNGNGNGTATA